MSYDFNRGPYFDDIDSKGLDGLTPKEKFQRILFRPGSAVQARELTQIQSLLQGQVSHIGDHLFKDGAQIIPGDITINQGLEYFTVDRSTLSTVEDVTEYIGSTFKVNGVESPLKAKVVNVYKSSVEDDPVYFYVNYLNSGENDLKRFGVASTLENIIDVNDTLTVLGNNVIVDTDPLVDDIILKASAASITEGIFYINKHFVIVQSQTIITDPAGILGTYDVGLSILEETVTITDDRTLGDNSVGTNNTNMSGADRFRIRTTLSTRDSNTVQEDFLILLSISNKKIIKKVDRTAYNILSKTFARRTYDESGDYTVRPFNLDITDAQDNVFNANLSASKAYVKGYEIETIAPTPITINELSSSIIQENLALPINNGNYIIVEDATMKGSFNTFNNVEISSEADFTGNDLGNFQITSIEPYATGYYKLYVRNYNTTANPLSGASNAYIRQRINADTTTFTATVALNVLSSFAEVTDNIGVYKLPNNNISLLSSDIDGNGNNLLGISSYTQHVTNLAAVVSAGTSTEWTATFTLTGAYQFEESLIKDKSILLVDDTDHSPISILESHIVSPISTNSITIEWNTITGETADLLSTQVKLICPVKSIDKLPRTKTLTDAESTYTNTISAHIPFELNPSSVDERFYDIYDIISIHDSDDDSETPIDYKEHFNVNNGQTDTYYGKSKLVYLGTGTIPAHVIIKYRYFSHGVGDFFSRESYPTLSNAELPRYNSSKYNEEISVGDIIDFRKLAHQLIDYSPQDDSNIIINTAFALSRFDRVVLNQYGDFKVIEGTPSLNPVLSEVPDDSMPLYNLTIPSFSSSATDIKMKRIDNKRYTMRDIGKIEKRVNNLEYYTSLSLLETEAMFTDVGGKFKSGFVVDSFNTHSIGDTKHLDYKCSIDKELHSLRPLSTRNNVELEWKLTNQAAGINIGVSDWTENVLVENNIKKTGDLVTIDYDSVPLLVNIDATGFINVNPYEVFNFTGSMEISPQSDDWKEIDQRPDVVFEQEGLYDAMLNMLDTTDAAGTIWNDWETTWSGVTDQGVTNLGHARGGSGVAGDFTTSQTSQTRSGIQTGVSDQTEVVDMGSRVVEVNFVPFIRSRLVSFKVTGLRPNTKLKAEFDGVDVTAFCRGDQYFIPHTLNAVDADALMRANYGDDYLELPLTDVTEHPKQDNLGLTTDDAGEIVGSFWIPSSNALKFRTGARVFRLTDGYHPMTNVINRSLETTTASAEYTAQGIIQSTENISLSTRIPVISSQEVFEERDTFNTSVRWWDPLAQSFLLDDLQYPDGLFTTSIEIFFKKKDANIPVTLQIREMENGMPTQKVLPFSEVLLNPADVNVINETTLALQEVENYTSTTFTFKSPVYLKPGIEYCFVLMANSIDYEVWYATIGEKSLVSDTIITTQLYNGVMFKSQNASTWTPEQESDIPFVLNRAQFKIDETSTLKLVNKPITKSLLRNNPLTFAIAAVDGIYNITVHHKNNGFADGDTVTLSGIINPTDSTETTVMGYAFDTLNADHVVSDVEQDSYIIQIADTLRSANDNGEWTLMDNGGNGVVGTRNIRYSVGYFGVQQLEFSNANIAWSGVLTDVNNVATTNTLNFTPNATFYLNKLMKVNSGTSDTMTMTGLFTSSSDFVSPVVDMDRMSVTAIENRVTPTALSALSSYITKEITLNAPSNELRLYLDILNPVGTTIKILYKAYNKGQPESDFVEFPGTIINNDILTEHSLIKSDIAFDTFRIKIEMYSDNSVIVPICKNFRAIATI
jgi:hypothetical protein